MLKALKFVQGAVAKKDFLPAMTHFAIEKGTVRAYNGVLALCTPIDLTMDCKPKADKFVHAISKCPDDSTPVLTMTPAGRLSVKAGGFSAFVDCVQEDTPHVWPEGDRVDFAGDAVLRAFEAVEPFIGSDASRPWSNGVLLRGESAFATNNVTLVEYWIGAAFPRVVNVPRACVREMLRIKEAPTHAQMTDNSITFHYSENRWIRSQLFNTEWPDLKRILDVECSALPVDELLFIGLEKLKPFADKMGRVFIKGGKLQVVKDDGSEAAEFAVPGLQCEGVYSIEMLNLLQGIATEIDLTAYPKPCLFFGKGLRGAIIGMRM